MNDEAKGGSIGTVVLNLGLVLCSNGLVHLLVDEALHSVDVEDVDDDGMVRVGKDFFG